MLQMRNNPFTKLFFFLWKFQDEDSEKAPLQQLDGALRSSITALRSKLESLRIPVIPELDHQLFQRDFTIPTTGKQQQDNSAHSREPILSADIWTSLIYKALRGSVTGHPVMTESPRDDMDTTSRSAEPSAQPMKLKTLDPSDSLLEKSSVPTQMPQLQQPLFKSKSKTGKNIGKEKQETLKKIFKKRFFWNNYNLIHLQQSPYHNSDFFNRCTSKIKHILNKEFMQVIWQKYKSLTSNFSFFLNRW